MLEAPVDLVGEFLSRPEFCELIWQMAGSDNFDSLVGSNPVGVVFSEWALSHPDAWEYLRPILVENDGWALFIYTPRGRNHGQPAEFAGPSRRKLYAGGLSAGVFQ